MIKTDEDECEVYYGTKLHGKYKQTEKSIQFIIELNPCIGTIKRLMQDNIQPIVILNILTELQLSDLHSQFLQTVPAVHKACYESNIEAMIILLSSKMCYDDYGNLPNEYMKLRLKWVDAIIDKWVDKTTRSL